MVDPSWFCAQLCGVEGGSFMRWAGAWSGEEALCPQECGEDTDHSAASSPARCLSGETILIRPAALSRYGEVDLIWTASFGSPKTNGFCYTIKWPWLVTTSYVWSVGHISQERGELPQWEITAIQKCHYHFCGHKTKTTNTFSPRLIHKLSSFKCKIPINISMTQQGFQMDCSLITNNFWCSHKQYTHLYCLTVSQSFKQILLQSLLIKQITTRHLKKG